jgi:hypothetical protein
LEILSASLIVPAPTESFGACSTWSRFRSSLDNILLSVTFDHQGRHVRPEPFAQFRFGNARHIFDGVMKKRRDYKVGIGFLRKSDASKGAEQ